MKLSTIITLFFISIAGFLYSADILFDNTKDETAGNGDWIIDDDQPNPLPSALTFESDWAGAFSSWGYVLYNEGHTVKTLPSSEGISFGNPNNIYDLSNFDLFIMPDPQNEFTSDEINAITTFVYNGGSLFLIGNAVYTARIINGLSSPKIWNKFGIESYFGMKFNTTGNYSSYSANCQYGNFSHQILTNTDYGAITSIGFYYGAAMTLNPENNSTVEGLFWARQSDIGTNNNVLAACCSYGSGRVVAVGDVELIDDGTGSSSDDILTNGWNKTDVTNKSFILSATKWLINEQPEETPVATPIETPEATPIINTDLYIPDKICRQY